jgi:hypothetical protein
MAGKSNPSDRGPKQLSLPIHHAHTTRFDAGDLTRREAIREALTLDLADTDMPREIIAKELSRLTSEKISRNHIDNWTSEARTDRYFPIQIATAWMIVLRSPRLARIMLKGTGYGLADEETLGLAELGEVIIEERKLKDRLRKIKGRHGL